MRLTTCPDCGHPASGHTTTRGEDWGYCNTLGCTCTRGVTALFLPDDLDSMALRYAAARLELRAEKGGLGGLTFVYATAARYLRGLAR